MTTEIRKINKLIGGEAKKQVKAKQRGINISSKRADIYAFTWEQTVVSSLVSMDYHKAGGTPPDLDLVPAYPS